MISDQLVKLKCYNFSMKEHMSWALWIFNATYLFWGGAYFLQDLNFEFVIYVVVIVIIIGGTLSTTAYTRFPAWQLWLLSLWGLLHILGGAVATPDGVLFAYKIYPFFNGGGDFYVLKYDQIVHAYLYGTVAVMAFHLLRHKLNITAQWGLLVVSAILISVGISALNEIMEFLIAVNMDKNGVGGYENSMLDLIFNLGGAIAAVTFYTFLTRKTRNINKVS